MDKFLQMKVIVKDKRKVEQVEETVIKAENNVNTMDLIDNYFKTKLGDNLVKSAKSTSYEDNIGKTYFVRSYEYIPTEKVLETLIRLEDKAPNIYENLDYENLVILRNRLGESTDVEVIPPFVDDWYKDIHSEEGYLVNLNGVYGYLVLVEFAHMGQPLESEGYDFAEKRFQRTDEDVFAFMEDISEELKEEVLPFKIYIGNKTGVENCHELSVFVPCGYTMDDIQSITQVLNSTIKKNIDARWQEDIEEMSLPIVNDEVIAYIESLKNNPICNQRTVDIVLDILAGRMDKEFYDKKI